MASSTPATADTMVTLKVNFQGITRRAKMPLREMVPSVLDSQIRTFLHIPPTLDTVIERYSDSASTYVVLDPSNMAVYKQLYRAAKAKSKLKLRVTIKNDKPAPAPKPVTVEDESEATASATENSTENTKEEIKQEKLPYTADASPATTAPATTATPVAAAAETKCPVIQPSVTFQQPIGHMRTKYINDGPELPRLPQQVLPRQQAQPSRSSAPTFAICCNSCEETIPAAHYHCSTCDDGDFDLCQSCVDKGILCYSSEHWLIKRTVQNGQITNSTTETIAPKPKPKKEEAKPAQAPRAFPVMPPHSIPAMRSMRSCGSLRMGAFPPAPAQVPAKLPQLPLRSKPLFLNARTCNCCVEEHPEHEFIHCNMCDDFDLCKSCFEKDGHGHHPKHSFSPAVPGTQMPDHIKVKMTAGRNQMHNAICDGCDKYINGVRHKCLDCPDWDYCNECIFHASFVHANHRFVPIYEAIMDGSATTVTPSVHMGICCDGPLCSVGKGYPTYIRGVRYKCAICHDLDFCANCEASPANEHNKTHPLIKFKTPVRNVSVTTSGEHHNGKQMPAMGDQVANATTPEPESSAKANSINAVQTVFDVKPVETEVKAVPTGEAKVKAHTPVKPPVKPFDELALQATYQRDSVADGTIFPPNKVFEQTWTLKNEGDVAWPAGCSIKFVGGDYMGNLDPSHPAKISELMKAAESSPCESPIAPGEEHNFTVPLRTPARAGRFVSYWRLTTQSGWKFGHRVWCDVSVRTVKSETVSPVAEPEPAKEEPKEEVKKEEPMKTSTMIFPKLDKESPVSSMHEEAPAKSSTAEEKSAESDEFEDCAEDDEWDASDDGFLTDEEYDILDASDEEFLEDQQKKMLKK